MTTKLTDDMIRELCVICTRDKTGTHFAEQFVYLYDIKHFPRCGFHNNVRVGRLEEVMLRRKWSDHHQALEDLGLIKINRPVHQSGTPYSIEHWTLDITDQGQQVVDDNPDLHPAGPDN